MTQPTGSQVDVSLEDRPGGLIAVVSINNPSRLNAMNAALMDQFVQTVNGLAGNEHLRALVVRGAGDKAFVGGADITEMAAIGDVESARAFINRVHACCDAVRAVPVPTIARIQGFAFGAGLELAASCDLRVASDTAVFGMPEVRLGIPSVVEAALLPMLVGWGRARQMLLLGENFSAADALAWGLVQQVTAAWSLDDAVEAWIEQTLKGAPGAVRLQKQLIRAWEDLPLRAAVQAGVDAFGAAFETDEPATIMAAFLAERARIKAER